jgi:hypothetical protein
MEHGETVNLLPNSPVGSIPASPTKFRRVLPANKTNFKTIIFEKKKHSELL